MNSWNGYNSLSVLSKTKRNHRVHNCSQHVGAVLRFR